MFHEIEDIEREQARLSHRPSPEEAPPVLSAFDLRANCSVAELDARLRSVLAPALELALSESFEGGDLPVRTLPDWFVAAARESSGPVPEHARRGTERYTAAIGKEAWDLQEWLYQFDPESEFRGWAWWDLTRSSDREARLWVDSWGESFFACDELRWVAYICGCEEVIGPNLARTDEWIAAIA
jgi:hypothetical protein